MFLRLEPLGLELVAEAARRAGHAHKSGVFFAPLNHRQIGSLAVSVLDMTGPRGHLTLPIARDRAKAAAEAMRRFVSRQILIIVRPQLARGRRRKSQYDPLKTTVRVSG